MIHPFLLTDTGFSNQDEVTYPFDERGLQFGDGVYEVIRLYNGNYYLLTEHIERLFRSAEAISLHLPFSEKTLTDNLHRLISINQVTSDSMVYLQATRGSHPRDHAFPLDAEPNFYAYVKDMPRKVTQMTEGVAVTTYPDERWKNCYIKSLNLLPNVLAKQTATRLGCFEAILVNEAGEVTEGSASNIFVVKNGVIYTHPATKRILNGVVRMRVKTFCEENGLSFLDVRPISGPELFSADEVFLTSSTAEIMPIIKVDSTVIGNGKPGFVTKTLQTLYERDANISEKRTQK